VKFTSSFLVFVLYCIYISLYIWKELQDETYEVCNGLMW